MEQPELDITDSLDLHRKRPTLKPLKIVYADESVKDLNMEEIPKDEGIYHVIIPKKFYNVLMNINNLIHYLRSR